MPISQPTLVLAFALSLGLVSAAAVASGAFIKARIRRVLHIGACAAGIIFLGRVLTELDLRFNFTPSMPLGIYRITPVPPKGQLPRGAFVAACAPHIAAELGRRRGYLAAGPCPADTELLLKIIVAVGGDDVVISANGVSINGCALPHSRQLAVDVEGRRLSRWPQGRYRLRSDQLWLYAANDRSWDSRYWGPVAAADATARVAPLVTSPLAFRSTSGEPNCGPAVSARPRLIVAAIRWPSCSHASDRARPLGLEPIIVILQCGVSDPLARCGSHRLVPGRRLSNYRSLLFGNPSALLRETFC
jgi:conjugative transfer signal peptidase TraF